jgi:hypothetical protein
MGNDRTVSEEIEEMLGDIPASKDEGEDEEVEETLDESEEVSEVTEEAVEDEEETADESEEAEREEVEEEEETGATGDGEEEVDESEEGEEEDAVSALRTQANEYAALLLKHGISLPGAQEETSVETPAAPLPSAAQAAAIETPSGSVEILGEGESFDDVINDRESFTKWASGFAQRIENKLSGDYMRSIPNVVAPQVRQLVELNMAVNEFYEVHEDLKPVRQMVGAVSNQIVQEHPDWTMQKVMEESAVRTRKVLKMPNPGKEVKGKKKVVRPSFVKGNKGGRKPKPKVSDLQKEIDELL